MGLALPVFAQNDPHQHDEQGPVPHCRRYTLPVAETTLTMAAERAPQYRANHPHTGTEPPPSSPPRTGPGGSSRGRW
jgi:hypothetical protein